MEKEIKVGDKVLILESLYKRWTGEIREVKEIIETMSNTD